MANQSYNDGGPAFPRPASEFTASGTVAEGNDAIREQDGMSLRDYFAAHALSAVIEVYRFDNGGGIGTDHLPRNVAAHAYRIADAMLEARQR